MHTTTIGGLIWVCDDCMFAHATGDVDPDADPAPWSLDPFLDVTMGGNTHPDDCPIDGDCDCDVITFSTSRCDGCGTHLAGTRHAFTWWADLAPGN